MTNSSKTHITFVLDRSGSMADCKTDTEGGFNAFIADQAKEPGECSVTLTQFDTQFDTVYSNVLITDVPPLVLVPRGMTALLDALGKAIVETGESLAALPEDERPGVVLFVVMTDGAENASREYKILDVKNLIKEQTDKYQWQFIFLGANMDAVNTGVSYGVSAATSMTYDVNNAQSTYASLSTNTSNLRKSVYAGQAMATASAALDFTDEQRDEAVSK